MVSCLARRRLRSRLWKGTVNRNCRCKSPPAYDLTPHRTLDLVACVHFQQIFESRRRRLLKIAGLLYELGMAEGSLLEEEIEGWRADEAEMLQKSKIVVANFF